MALFGWFELNFGPGFDTYQGSFGNNGYEAEASLYDGQIHSEVGIRIGLDANSPFGTYESMWRNANESIAHPLTLTITRLSNNDEAFLLVWSNQNSTKPEFEGVGNLLSEHRMVGWYRETSS